MLKLKLNFPSYILQNNNEGWKGLIMTWLNQEVHILMCILFQKPFSSTTILHSKHAFQYLYIETKIELCSLLQLKCCYSNVAYLMLILIGPLEIKAAIIL